MQKTLTFPPLTPSETEMDPTFNIVIAYEDFETGKHAKKTCDFLVEHLGQEYQFNNQMWKFDVLSVPKLKEMAAKDAAGADIILISTHAANELPAEVKSWIELWVTEKSRAIALVGLFDAEQDLKNPVHSYLGGVAKRAGMEFFAQPGLWPGQQKEETQTFTVWDNNRKPFPPPAEGADISHWGINE